VTQPDPHDITALERLGIPPASSARVVGMISGAMSRACSEKSSHDPQCDRPRDTLPWGRKYLPEHFAKPASAMHVWLGQQLDALQYERGTKVNLIGPRGGAKSTIGTLCYVLRAAVERTEPYIWIVSDTKHQAQTHLENVKAELVDNRLLAADYPEAVGRGRRWQSTSIELPNKVVIESFGTGQRIRGRRRHAYRPTLIVCDDLQNDGHIASAVQRDASRRWFHGTLLKAGKKETNILNLATALHRDALAMELHTAAGWTSARFPAIRSWPTRTDLWQQWEAIYCDAENPNASVEARNYYDRHRAEMDAGTEVLWPEEEDLYTLMRMRVESGHAAFDREKQGSPIDPELCEWPEEYFEDHIWFQRWPAELAVKTIALDPSKGGDARRGDYSALVMLGVDRSGLIYVEADLARRPTPQIVADGAAWCERFRPSAFGVEANQFQELLAGELAAEFRRQGIGHVVPAAIHNHVNKQVRIRRLGPYLSRRRLRFLAGSASTRLLVDQLRDFPAGAHDDGPDALEMALRLAEELLHGRRADDGLGNRLPVG
jgi:predicted phage terminase large subunit-like protein